MTTFIACVLGLPLLAVVLGCAVLGAVVAGVLALLREMRVL